MNQPKCDSRAVKGRGDPSSAIISVCVKPRSSANRIVGMKNGALVVHVTSPPIEGKANCAAIATLAEALGIAQSKIEIVSGGKSRHKTVRIQGVTVATIAARFPAQP